MPATSAGMTVERWLDLIGTRYTYRDATREAVRNAVVLPHADDYIVDRHISPWRTAIIVQRKATACATCSKRFLPWRAWRRSIRPWRRGVICALSRGASMKP